ncbi:hypothetical protein F4703DRAFT_1797935 [Phycomyces blakesleeanus]|uniref:Uncharacterized protein n=1 Tax=Phycomyces blakesleeanus (strain ATCC 8743b / DSM 1359 / FGSC 10004 / NBRC 33097 / NRRL 1555) TaxID=763407 RepID=A0A162N766_PHYB8|nr:hypothetical protein PHYBLDRAFT_70865 [Phycomyces blakesleeanus NRRL 1555(-)]OAD66404.1 hypothetical protein PHYBLDRAFT_70865 [Phycomyces blakesleeanus NRRL 1555(-)]|eukprot:XP_018284444.1 hypothetical protein PHYBLDRAFT_70865 [Phycomyces blakesleeanus NRRL 1555(-)]
MTNCPPIHHINRLESATFSVRKDTRDIVFRAKIFGNYYITLCSQQLQNNDIPHCIFTQHVWYSVCQMGNAKRVTSTINIPSDKLTVWNRLSSSYRAIAYIYKKLGEELRNVEPKCALSLLH